MADKTTYKTLRNQLVSISVDIDDKQKVCRALERKIAEARQALARVPDTVAEEYQAAIEDALQKHKLEEDKLKEESEELLTQKGQLVERCKKLVDEVQEQEKNTAAEIRAIFKDGEKAIEEARREFRSGYEDRLQQYVAARTREVKENTGKALKPEISRLQLQHEQELAELERELQTEELRLKEEMNSKLQTDLEAERKSAKEELELSVKSLQDSASSEIEIARRQHRREVDRLRHELSEDLSKHRGFLSSKSEKQRKEIHSEMKQRRESHQQRLLDLKQTHAKHIESLQLEHEKELRRIRKKASRNTRRNEISIVRHMKSDTEAAGSVNVRRQMTDSCADLDAIDNNKLQTQSANSLELSDSFSFGAVLEDDSISTGTDGLSMKYNRGKMKADDVIGSAEEMAVAKAKQEAEAERDKQIQAEIRALETESLRLERQWKAQSEEQRNSILKMHEKEKQGLDRKIRQSEDEVAELAATKEQLLRNIKEQQEILDALINDETELVKQISVYTEGIEAHRSRIRDKKELHRIHLREMQLSSGPKLRELKEDCENLEETITSESKAFEEKKDLLEKDNRNSLSNLNEQVVADVSNIDKEIAQLRDAVDSERAKIDRLNKLIEKYSGDVKDNVSVSSNYSSKSKMTATSNKYRNVSRTTESVISGNSKSSVTSKLSHRSMRSQPENKSRRYQDSKTAHKDQLLSSHRSFSPDRSNNIKKSIRSPIAEGRTCSNDTASSPSHASTLSAVAARTTGSLLQRCSQSKSNSSFNGDATEDETSAAIDLKAVTASGLIENALKRGSELDANEDFDDELLPAPPLQLRPHTPPTSLPVPKAPKEVHSTYSSNARRSLAAQYFDNKDNKTRNSNMKNDK